MRNYHECFPFTAELGPVSESVDHVQKLAVNTAASEGTSEVGKYIKIQTSLVISFKLML